MRAFSDSEIIAARDFKIEDLLVEVRAASDAYEAAKQREQFARNECTDALNKLNATQRAVDAALENQRIIAPRGSDWKVDASR